MLIFLFFFNLNFIRLNLYTFKVAYLLSAIVFFAAELETSRQSQEYFKYNYVRYRMCYGRIDGRSIP